MRPTTAAAAPPPIEGTSPALAVLLGWRLNKMTLRPARTDVASASNILSASAEHRA